MDYLEKERIENEEKIKNQNLKTKEVKAKLIEYDKIKVELDRMSQQFR